MNVLIVLQNAYDRGSLKAGERFNPATWRAEFLGTRTWTRLQRLFSRGKYNLHFTNAAPGIGSGPRSLLPVQHKNVKDRIRRVNPDIVIACGKSAEEACTDWSGNMMVIPHPAYMLLTNDLLDHAANKLRRSPIRVALRQGPGYITEEAL